MAVPNSRPTPSLMSVLIVFISFLMLAHNVKSISFKFPTFSPYTKAITFQGDAFEANGALQLTKTIYGAPQLNSAGRASYAAPIRLWNAKTGNLAAFTTTFSFVVAPAGPGPFGDGISFFIAPFNSKIPKDSSGGFLGLFNADSALNAYKNQIVAVEFDSFGNPWDPASAHIGIDINSIASAATVSLNRGNIVNGSTAFATISYEPLEKSLSVFLSYPQSRASNGTFSSLSFVVDLRTVLPEWVRIGFSGATGQLVEVHKILSWTFSSSFY